MAKFCRWCGREITEEIGSLELREFNDKGKVCSYFCDDTCMVIFINRRREETAMQTQNTSEAP